MAAAPVVPVAGPDAHINPSTPPSQLSPKLEQLTISSRRSSLRRREKEDQAQERRDETDFNHQFQNAKDTLSAMDVEKRRSSSERKASRVLRKAANVRVNASKCAERRRRRIETRDFGVSGASSELVMLANNTQNRPCILRHTSKVDNFYSRCLIAPRQ